jgi:imidazolonepropionase-like amidohydrolase
LYTCWREAFATHANGTDGIFDAIRAGVHLVEFASFLFNEGIALAKEKYTSKPHVEARYISA